MVPRHGWQLWLGWPLWVALGWASVTAAADATHAGPENAGQEVAAHWCARP